MPLYVAVPLTSNHDALDAAVQKYITSASDRYKLQADGGWLIKFGGTTVELCNHLKITGLQEGAKPAVTSVLVVPLTSYYGRGPTDMWEWIKSRLEA